MPGIITLALIAIVALTILSFAVHYLLSPWLPVAIVLLAWIKFWPGCSHRYPVPGRLLPRPALSGPPGSVVVAEQNP